MEFFQRLSIFSFPLLYLVFVASFFLGSDGSANFKDNELSFKERKTLPLLFFWAKFGIFMRYLDVGEIYCATGFLRNFMVYKWLGSREHPKGGSLSIFPPSVSILEEPPSRRYCVGSVPAPVLRAFSHLSTLFLSTYPWPEAPQIPL